MQSTRHILLKILRVRARLLKQRVGEKDPTKCSQLMRPLSAWLNAYPHATEAQVRRWAREHIDAWYYLCPGGSPGTDAIIKQLNTQLYADLLEK